MPESGPVPAPCAMWLLGLPMGLEIWQQGVAITTIAPMLPDFGPMGTSAGKLAWLCRPGIGPPCSRLVIHNPQVLRSFQENRGMPHSASAVTCANMIRKINSNPEHHKHADLLWPF